MLKVILHGTLLRQNVTPTAFYLQPYIRSAITWLQITQITVSRVTTGRHGADSFFWKQRSLS